MSIIEKRLPPKVKEKWSERAVSKEAKVDKTNKFPCLLEFLLEKKRAIRYDSADLRSDPCKYANYFRENNSTIKVSAELEHQSSGLSKKYSCWLHRSDNHRINECASYLSMGNEERVKLLRENKACWSCLELGHRSLNCKQRQVCEEDRCDKYHHRTLHAAHMEGVNFHSCGVATGDKSNNICLLQLMRIKTMFGWANTMWDCGATMSFITNIKAEEERLEGIPLVLTVLKVGGGTEKINAKKYELPLIH